MNNIGYAYLRQGNYPEALNYLEQSQKVSKQIGEQACLARCYNNIGSVYRHKKDYAKARDQYNAGLKIAEETGNKRITAIILGHLGMTYIAEAEAAVGADTEKVRTGISFLKRSIDLCEEDGEMDEEIDFMSSASQGYSLLGDYKTALDWSRKSNIRREISAADQNKVMMADMESHTQKMLDL